jgi:hypothetical protein
MTVLAFRYNPSDPRLGRHVRHDTRSAAYGVAEMPRAAIRSVEWERHIPILDQGQIGSCVPNNAPEFLGTDALGYTGVTSVEIPKPDTKGEFAAGVTWTLDEDFALQMYRLVTRLDPYPGQWEPDDTGSDGLTLAKAGPDGKITIDYNSGVAGGHQVFARKFDAENDRVWIDNSWGESFGLDGRGWFQGSELAAHLKRSGDVTVPHLAAAAPSPAPAPADAVSDAQLWTTVKAWAASRGLS